MVYSLLSSISTTDIMAWGKEFKKKGEGGGGKKGT